MHLEPGDRHPNAPCAAADLARRLGVDVGDLRRWLDEGMPALSDGRVDPYAVTNWLSWGRLDRCPALQRRWRAWLRWFTTVGRPCRLEIRRAQTCHLPVPRPLRWLVPEPADGPGQRVLARTWDEGDAVAGCRLLVRAAAEMHAYACVDEIALQPVDAPVRDRTRFEELVAEQAATFTYAYRRHGAADTAVGMRDDGTCLDLALRCGAAASGLGRRWRLVSGVVAHRALANAHFWLEVEDVGGAFVPIDPTIPAVARMLGADWRAVVPLAVGRHDARRIALASCEGPVRNDLGGIGGRLDAGGDDALYCSDWAVGECAWSVAGA